MNVNNNKFEVDPYVNIDSEKDLLRILNNLYDEGIFKFSLFIPNDVSKEIDKWFDLGDRFKKVYWVALGGPPCKEVIEEVGSCQKLLDHSITTCSDIVPLLLRSFKCHQKALTYFKDNRINLAVEQMAKTGKLAKEIGKKYEELTTSFSLLWDQVCQTTVNLMKNKIPVAEVWKIQVVLLEMEQVWGFMSSEVERLGETNLADLDDVELMLDCKESKVDGYQFFENAEKVLSQALPQPPVKKTLQEVVQSMKTGGELSSPVKTPIVDMLKLFYSEGIAESYASSRLGWLALAKANDIMIKFISDVSVNIQKAQKDISLIESDSLAIALHKAALE